MKHFFFVEVHMVGDGTEESPSMLSFRHVILEADSIDDAYGRGPALMSRIYPELEGRLMNDYVIEIPEGGSNGMV